MATSTAWRKMILIALALSCARAEHVETLTQADFDQRTAQGRWLLNFHAPWCAHCKRLAPVYEKVAEHFAADRSAGVHVAKVDATSETEIAERFSIAGFPSIVLFQGGEVHAFKGARTFEDILQFVEGRPLKAKGRPASASAGEPDGASAQLAAAGERALAAARQLREGVREVFTTLTVSEVAWSAWRVGASLSALIFVTIASVQLIERPRADEGDAGRW